jgi:hypothetical protein
MRSTVKILEGWKGRCLNRSPLNHYRLLCELLCFLQLSETENMTRNKGIAMIENSQAIWKYTVRQSTKLAR